MKLLFLLVSIIATVQAQNTLSITSTTDKYIVVTTINYPTQALKKLASQKGWRLVVVADKKTPVDWHLENCDFLSVEKQLSLGYAITKLLPWNHYSRKNIGYLYAIQQGASVIYETDDDNLLKSTIDYLPEKYSTASLSSSNQSVNICAYFGQDTVWPRGYPLEAIALSKNFAVNTVSQQQVLAVQQALVDKDPDVDALFRLTREHEIFFDCSKQPVSIAQYTFCPFNSQNTLFYKRAFWGLLIPATTSFRVCDIWRGYITQRLLWDIGAAVCFLPPSVVQERNEHDLLCDFQQEIDLYLKAGALVNLLKNWRSGQPSLAHRFIGLVDLLVQQGFYKNTESDLVRAWISDLEKVGYIFPDLAHSAVTEA